MKVNDIPWLAPKAIEYLDIHLKSNHKLFEFGSGGSTKWFIDRVSEVVSVEHQLEWYKAVKEEVKDCPNCTYIHSPTPYDSEIKKYPNEYFDVVLVDGRRRNMCAKAAISKIKPGGMLILDDSERPRYRNTHQLVKNWPKSEFVEKIYNHKAVPVTCRDKMTTIWFKPMKKNY